MVQLRHAGRRVCLGYFHDELAAAKAYDSEVLRLKGPKSPINFPDPELGREFFSLHRDFVPKQFFISLLYGFQISLSSISGLYEHLFEIHAFDYACRGGGGQEDAAPTASRNLRSSSASRRQLCFVRQCFPIRASLVLPKGTLPLR